MATQCIFDSLMTREQAGGYIFESIIWRLLSESGYVKVKGSKLKGRGGLHQIDAVGFWQLPVPFVYPVRLMLESKFKPKAGLGEVRSFLGAYIDIKENYVVRGKSLPARYTDVACMCCKGSFTTPAQDYAWAQNIFLVSFQNVRSLASTIQSIDEFVNSLDETELERTKEELIANFSARSPQMVSDQILVVGMLNGKYPVMLSTSQAFLDLLQRRNLQFGDVLQAIKTERDMSELETVYRIGSLDGTDITLEFALSNGIANKLSKRIDRTPRNKKIFEIEVPAVSYKAQQGTRRLFRIDVVLG